MTNPDPFLFRLNQERDHRLKQVQETLASVRAALGERVPLPPPTRAKNGKRYTITPKR